MFQDCLLGSARCVLFQCPLLTFSDSIHFRIRAYMWNSTFIEVIFFFIYILTQWGKHRMELIFTVHYKNDFKIRKHIDKKTVPKQ